MNVQQTAALLALIAVVDRRHIDDPVVLHWHDLVADINFDDACEAVREHRRTSTEYLVPAHVRVGVGRLRARRLDAAAPPDPPADVADDPAAWLRWKRATAGAIADGAYAPPDPPRLVRRPGILRAVESTFRRVGDAGEGAT